MVTETAHPMPKARSEGLVIQDLADEVLVYDLERDKAHCLNQTAALVWRHCDGKNTVSEIARVLSKEAGSPVSDEVVWLALGQLKKAQLVSDPVKPGGRKRALTRREVIKRVGIGAAVAIPVVTSIVAPLAVQAATCLGSGQTCTSSAQCCSGLCSSNKCV